MAPSLEGLEAEIPGALQLLVTQRAPRDSLGPPLADLATHQHDFMQFLATVGLGHLCELFDRERVSIPRTPRIRARAPETLRITSRLVGVVGARSYLPNFGWSQNGTARWWE